MILLDFDNLNILVLFILAFISFKSYQADHHELESESDQELSEAEHSQSHQNSEEKSGQKPQMKSQANHQDQENSLCPQGGEKFETEIHDSLNMVSEQIGHSQNQLYLNENIIREAQQTQGHEQLNVVDERQQNESSESDQAQVEKCDEEVLNENEDSNSSLKNPESIDSYSEQDDQEQEGKDQIIIGLEKRKKIRKGEKKSKRESIKQAQLAGQLREEREAGEAQSG